LRSQMRKILLEPPDVLDITRPAILRVSRNLFSISAAQ
jgi:hypothetical protein